MHRRTIPWLLPEYFFQSFFESTKKFYICFNDKKHLLDVISYLNALNGLEYTHTNISVDKIKSVLPMTIIEYSHVRNLWYKSNNKK